MSVSKPIWTNCRACGRNTRHEILFQHIEDISPEYYHERETWQVVRCLGCETIGFRYRHDDFENVWEDHDGTVQHDIVITDYPRVIRNHKKLGSLYYVPALISRAYTQTLSAYSDQAFVLASIGLRATIEAVCNHLKLSGSSLEKRIDQLYRGGYVSNGDKKLLHAIRFLGNDAAHEIKEPKESELRVALEIVEHLLNSVFILEKKAKSLDVVVETFEEFLPILESCLRGYQGEPVFSLTSLLGRRRRLVGQNLDAFEAKLKEQIVSGDISYLLMVKEEKVGGREVQLYCIGDTGSLDQDEDIPF